MRTSLMTHFIDLSVDCLQLRVFPAFMLIRSIIVSDYYFENLRLSTLFNDQGIMDGK